MPDVRHVLHTVCVTAAVAPEPPNCVTHIDRPQHLRATVHGGLSCSAACSLEGLKVPLHFQSLFSTKNHLRLLVLLQGNSHLALRLSIVFVVAEPILVHIFFHISTLLPDQIRVPSRMVDPESTRMMPSCGVAMKRSSPKRHDLAGSGSDAQLRRPCQGLTSIWCSETIRMIGAATWMM